MLLANLEQAAYAHRKQMQKAIGWQEMGLARELIRSDDSVSLLVHPDPAEIENPYALESFSLFSGTLSGQLALNGVPKGCPTKRFPGTMGLAFAGAIAAERIPWVRGTAA